MSECVGENSTKTFKARRKLHRPDRNAPTPEQPKDIFRS